MQWTGIDRHRQARVCGRTSVVGENYVLMVFWATSLR
jgi:hypothetical protein